MATYDGWDGSAVLLVAHGGTISALTSNLLGLDEGQYPLLKSLSNINMARLQAMPRYREGHSVEEAGLGDSKGVQWYLEAWNQGLNV